MVSNPPRATQPRVSAVVGVKAVYAVVTLEDPDIAARLANVLGDSGIEALEITLRTPAALPAIAAAVAEKALVVGAGTVVDADSASAAVDAGAAFLVSPGYDGSLAEPIGKLGVPLLPGVLTPSELLVARRDGFREVKLFPVERFGGLELVATYAAVFPDIAFVPTGGVDHEAALRYLGHSRVVGVGGSWMAPAEMLATRNWDAISRLARSIADRRAPGSGEERLHG